MEFKERREILHSSLSAFIIAGIFLVIALCFIPLTIIEDEFIYNSVEAIFMYILFATFLAFLIFAIVKLVIYLKETKASKIEDKK